MGVGVVGLFEGLCCKVGDACSRWSHIWSSWYFPIEGWALHTDEHGFLDDPGVTVSFLVYYVELFWVHWVTCGGAMVVYRRRALKCSLTLSPKYLPDSPT